MPLPSSLPLRPVVITSLPRTLSTLSLHNARAAYHYHVNTLGKIPPSSRARAGASPHPSRLYPPLCLRHLGPLSSYPVRTLPNRPLVTSRRPTGHICKTCHYYNNITPMNLPLNARMHGLANYTPGGAIRTDAVIAARRYAMRRRKCNCFARLSARVFFLFPSFFGFSTVVYN